MTTGTDDREQEQDSPAEEYDPFEYVPDRIDQVTASGFEHLHDALAERNKRKLRSMPVEQQAGILWSLADKGAIDLDITAGREGDR